MKTFKLLILVLTILLAHIQINYAQNQDSVKVINVKVKGITCANDLKTISNNVEKLAGVSTCKSVKMSATSSFEIKFNPAKITEKEIYTAIENTGGCENPNDKPYKVK
ncbi:MAG TPA: heavy metal-associated domain-containing protein [Bacteroidia bacterium]|nr:heavy metal-associated domain-containing protein [Bacteroidia bacterium]